MEKINREGQFSGELRYDEPMSAHTTFKVGGKADAWVRPEKDIFPAYAAKLLEAAEEEGVPVFVLGGGANIVVGDGGIRGIVLDTGSWQGMDSPIESEEEAISVRLLSGSSVDGIADQLAAGGLSGLEFLAGMPGSVGGAIWMNARCYERSVSDALIETEILDEDRRKQAIPFRPEDFSYKKSPFQGRKVIILSGRFAVRVREPKEIYDEMAVYRRDRVDKGHYRFPSAGSAFKNNRDFGDPTGRIIDQLGLRGFSVGGAQVAPWHGNIIINTGGATATDIKLLAAEVARRVKEERGFELESEILYIGE
ncbi:MAG: UDP-N-acetylmuramate dehydrogenase [Treponema sp.]|nr:UDP-N-acetylmuramate dehydrogenase [Treponema sp.]